MLSLDVWQEILDTTRKNKLRSFLTGFSVAWGIFMLVVLLGSGTGLKNGIEHEFRDDAINSLWIRSGQTSVPYRGLQPGRDIRFTNRDHDSIETTIDGVEHITSRFYIRGNTLVTYGKESGTYDVRSVHPDHRYLENTIMTAGRFLNDLDLREHRKVAVLGELIRDDLFGDDPGIGEYIHVNGIAFKVIGVFEDTGGENEMRKIYLPISTAQRTFNGRDRVAQIMVTVGDAGVEESEVISRNITRDLAARHRFDPEDRRAVFINNNLERFQRFLRVIGGMKAFIWVIGFGTLLAGVVGISNIMMITVRERTKEFGVRKALGATPGSIVGLILQEAVFITGVAGYIGLVLGVAVLEAAATNLPGSSFFRNPSVDLTMALYATLLLVVAGATAGLVPAIRAARIRPIEALRDE